METNRNQLTESKVLYGEAVTGAWVRKHVTKADPCEDRVVSRIVPVWLPIPMWCGRMGLYTVGWLHAPSSGCKRPSFLGVKHSWGPRWLLSCTGYGWHAYGVSGVYHVTPEVPLKLMVAALESHGHKQAVASATGLCVRQDKMLRPTSLSMKNLPM